jgi:hypothetical protein
MALLMNFGQMLKLYPNKDMSDTIISRRSPLMAASSHSKASTHVTVYCSGNSDYTRMSCKLSFGNAVTMRRQD